MNKLSFITFPSISRLFIHTNIYSFVFELFFIWSYKPLSAIFFSKKRVLRVHVDIYVRIPACHCHVRQYKPARTLYFISSHAQKVTYTEPGWDGCSQMRATIIFFIRPGGSVGRKPETDIFLSVASLNGNYVRNYKK